jgi:arsenite methyltransferase
MASARCAAQVAGGVVEVREGTAERSGCGDASVDVAISVNNVMLWDRQAVFADPEFRLRPRRFSSPAVELVGPAGR